MATVTDKKFTKPVKPALESVTIELSAKEAELVRLLTGRVMNGNGDRDWTDTGRSIWNALQRAEVPSISDKVGVFSGWNGRERQSSLTVKKG